MVKGRRTVQKLSCNKPLIPSSASSQTVRRHSQKLDEGPPIPPTMPPKHVPIPNIPKIPELAFEFFMMVFSTLTLGLSYLNLYRTVFWLPHSHTQYAMHFQLIDKALVCFILIVLGRRLLWCLIKTLFISTAPQQYWSMGLKLSRALFMVFFSISLILSMYSMTSSFTLLRIASLLYPFAFFLCIYWLDATSFLEVIPAVPLEEEKSKSSKQANLIRSVSHSCSNSAEAIRLEVKFLKENCNRRISLVIFQTVMCVHYTTLIPCLFAPKALFYDSGWIKIQVVFVSLTFFFWHLVFCFPARYCDTMHRAALHLGSWSKLDMRSNHAPFNTWSQSFVWPQGAHVKYMKEFYRAEGITNAAEPGNSSHMRLYYLFAEPWRLQLTLVVIQSICSVFHLLFLTTLEHWQQLLGTGFILAASYAALFILLRDYIVLRRVYQYEILQQAKVVS